jgi:tetratricopeptide (TPR) repeat protein
MSLNDEAQSDVAFRRWLAALDAALAGGRQDEALSIARALPQAGGVGSVASLQVAGAVLQQAGAFDEAIALHRRAVKLAPGAARVKAGLADCLFDARRPEAALAAWDEALALTPDDPEILSGKARVLHGLGRVDEAGDLFRRARQGDKRCFKALFGLALLALEAGRLEEAEVLTVVLRELAPDRSDVRWLAARTAFGRGEMATAERRIEEMLRDPRLTLAQRAEALLMRGGILDQAGSPSLAFAAAVEGKAIQRRLFAERASAREGEIAKLNRLAHWFGRAGAGAWGPARSLSGSMDGEAMRHVFLVGFPRSGTTLIEQALAGHQDVAALEEAPTLSDAYAAFLASDEGCERLARLTGGEADQWRARYWAAVRAHGIEAGGKVFLDKAPGGTLTLPLIAKLFPRAKVLFALRDPRDVVLSCLRNAFQMNAMTYAFTTLEETAACYGACMALAEVYRGVLAADLLDVRLEALIDDFAGGLAEICRFIGIEAQPAMLDIAATARRRSVRTPSAAQVRAGLNRGGVGRWRAYAPELAPVMESLAPWIERFGYGEGRI